MKNSEFYRLFTSKLRNILRSIYRCLAFLNIKWFGKWLLPHAACVFIENKEGKILAVSRKNDPTKFGLPGGKVDPGELDIEAAKRELKEETGIHVSWFSLRKIFEDTDDFEYWTICYYACLTYTPSIGEKALGEQGEVRWVDREVLTSGIFGTFNTKLIQTLDKIKTEECIFCGVRHG